MYSTYFDGESAARTVIASFGGLNRRARIAENEFSDMTNLSSDDCPLLATRARRTTVQRQLALIETETVTDEDGNEKTVETTVYKKLNGILGDVGFAVVWGGDFYYLGKKIDTLSLTDGEKRMLAFGAYILIYPDAKWYNTVTGEVGEIDRDKTGYTGSISPFRLYADGKYYKSSDDAVQKEVLYTYENGEVFGSTEKFYIAHPDTADRLPDTVRYVVTATPSIKCYLCDGELYYPYAATVVEEKTYTATLAVTEWKRIVTGHITFASGDAPSCVTDAEKRKNLWNGDRQIILVESTSKYSVSFDKLTDVFSGMSSGKLSYQWEARSVPILDCACVCGNRLWGCRYGVQIGGTAASEAVSEIYCSALGDFSNFTVGTTADAAWTATVGAYGAFTGCVTLGGRVFFFKEDKLIRVGGTKPSDFQYTEISDTGLARGCEKSMQIIDGVLYYKARDGIYAYDGAMPERISDKLGDAQYAKTAVAGSLYGKYYISLDGVLYVYDTHTGLWHKEDVQNIRFFTRYDGALYAGVDNDILCLVGTPSDIFDGAVREDAVLWSAESGDIGLDAPMQKYYRRLLIRAWGEDGAELSVCIEADGKATPVRDYVLSGLETLVLPITTPRCDHMRVKLDGRGDVKIYSLSYETETVGDLPERR